MDEEVILHKSEKKKHQRSKEKEALSSSEVPTEMENKHKRNKEEALSSSEVPKEKKHKKSKEKDVLSSSEVPKEKKKKRKKSKEKEAISSSEVPTEKKKKHKEKEATSSSEVPTEKKKHKKSKENEILSTSEVPTEKKKHRKSKEKEALSSSEVPIDVGGEKKVKGSRDKEGFPDNGREESGKRKNKKGKEKVTECSDVECATDQAASKGKDHIDVSGEENNENVKNGKGKKNERENANGGDSEESFVDKSGSEAGSGCRSSKKRNREEEVLDVAIGEEKKKKKKKTKMDANIENTKANVGDVETEYNFGSTNEQLRNSDAKKSSKRVKFASHVEVFPLSDDQDDWEENPGNKLVQGKRFTGNEDQIIKDAVDKYIEAHKLGAEGLDMILHCKKYPNIRNCWKEIGAALPYRPCEAVYHRAHTLYERAESRKWTEDEKAFILKFYEKHGSGNWSQTEYQSLFHLVNKDMRMRVFEEKASKHGMIHDNISWTAISYRLATRTGMHCCKKWYEQLTSSMVKEGKWADTDDYRLLDELLRLDACCVEDVDWDNLLEHR
ncbi:hypothetical protein MKW98_018917 [Papaver atlanticum]|uniref:Myb-like domain-containing protein n=1 Tax=Papaver atlanticum TaxID=357466 RepID=A0AAD4TJF4_9MAGN|nr:hypothetical protein MKW98_018917 [Papaver atlanticum]